MRFAVISVALVLAVSGCVGYAGPDMLTTMNVTCGDARTFNELYACTNQYWFARPGAAPTTDPAAVHVMQEGGIIQKEVAAKRMTDARAMAYWRSIAQGVRDQLNAQSEQTARGLRATSEMLDDVADGFERNRPISCRSVSGTFSTYTNCF